MKLIYDRLSRQTSSGGFIPEIDGLRFVAVMAVVLFHIRGYLVEKSGLGYTVFPEESALYRQISFGHFGVELFFVISGFILAVPFILHHLSGGKKVVLKKYFVRRLTRLEPPYIINMVLLFFLLIIVKGEPFTELVPNLLASLGYQHNTLFGENSLINTVAWSLEVEVQFYLLVPILTLIFLIKQKFLRRTVLFGIAMVCVMLRLLVLPSTGHFSITLLHYLQYFLMGFFLADIYLLDWKEKPAQTYLWDVIGLLAWTGLGTVVYYQEIALFLFPPLTLLAYIAAFRGHILNWLFNIRLLTVIGGMCYTIYLFHYQIISAIGRFSLPVGSSDVFWQHYLIQSLILVPVILLVSAVFFLLFEKPFMNPRWFEQTVAKFKKVRSSAISNPEYE